MDSLQQFLVSRGVPPSDAQTQVEHLKMAVCWRPATDSHDIVDLPDVPLPDASHEYPSDKQTSSFPLWGRTGFDVCIGGAAVVSPPSVCRQYGTCTRLTGLRSNLRNRRWSLKATRRQIAVPLPALLPPARSKRTPGAFEGNSGQGCLRHRPSSPLFFVFRDFFFLIALLYSRALLLFL